MAIIDPTSHRNRAQKPGTIHGSNSSIGKTKRWNRIRDTGLVFLDSMVRMLGLGSAVLYSKLRIKNKMSTQFVGDQDWNEVKKVIIDTIDDMPIKERMEASKLISKYIRKAESMIKKSISKFGPEIVKNSVWQRCCIEYIESIIGHVARWNNNIKEDTTKYSMLPTEDLSALLKSLGEKILDPFGESDFFDSSNFADFSESIN